MKTKALFLTKFAGWLLILSLSLGCQGTAEDQADAQQTAQNSEDTARVSTGQLPDAQSAEAASQKTVTTGTRDVSSIFIGFEAPGELLLTDPQGRRVGLDPVTGESTQEIPNASYYREYIEDIDGQGGPESKQLEVMTPPSGDYKIVVSGVEDSLYNIGIFCFDSNKGSIPSRSDFGRIPILPTATHAYTLSFDKTSAAQCFVAGGFEGGGESSDIDRLLSYVNITADKTDLPTGTSNTNLFVIYGKTVVPESFEASLNGGDVSNLFKPAAGGHEIVSIPLKAGKNELKLSVNGDIAGEINTDTDNLVFHVK